MSNTDFFDDDLVRPQNSTPTASTVSIQESPQQGDMAAAASAMKDDRVVSDVDLARMSKHRDQLEGQAAKTITEIERLKQRTDDLEFERQQLDDLRKKQDGYVSSKRETMQRLHQSLLAIEKEEVKATQLVELYGDTRQRFRKMLAEIEDIDETEWPEDRMKDQLSKSQDLIDSIRVECSKALVKLDTFAGGDPTNGPESANKSAAAQAAAPQGFGHWLKVGLAISIPMAVLIVGAGTFAFYAVTQWLP